MISPMYLCMYHSHLLQTPRGELFGSELTGFWEDTYDSRVYAKLRPGGLYKALSLTLLFSYVSLPPLSIFARSSYI